MNKGRTEQMTILYGVDGTVEKIEFNMCVEQSQIFLVRLEQERVFQNVTYSFEITGEMEYITIENREFVIVHYEGTVKI